MIERVVTNRLRHFFRLVDSAVTKWGEGPTSVTDSVPSGEIVHVGIACGYLHKLHLCGSVSENGYR